MQKKTSIVSIFGQIEGCIADIMAAEQGIHRIASMNIPPTARFDSRGRAAHCALVLTPEQEREFDQRVADLYA